MLKKATTLLVLMLTPVIGLADDIGHGGPDPDSTPPDTSTESVESTDTSTWWTNLLELFDLDTDDKE
jgi:hypothetical protein